jgi:hypothetical protein
MVVKAMIPIAMPEIAKDFHSVLPKSQSNQIGWVGLRSRALALHELSDLLLDGEAPATRLGSRPR